MSILVIMQVALSLWAQGLINKGAGIVVKSGAYVVVIGNFLNKIGTQDGFVKLDGNLIVKGDFINNASNEVFDIPSPLTNGWLIMPSTTLQKFRGSSAVRVNNLELSGMTKRIDLPEVKVVGTCKLAAILELNGHIFHLESSDPASLQYQSGYIKAETTPQDGLGYIRWDVGNANGNFNLPFGSGNSSYADLNLTLHLTQAGDNTGYFMCSTYGTLVANMPYPSGVTTLDPYTENEVANRFWIITPVFQNFPTGSITFQYTHYDIQGMDETQLKAANYDESQNLWIAWPIVFSDQMNNLLQTDLIQFSSVDYRWTLVSREEGFYLYMPTCFSPNEDGVNDFFVPVISGDYDNYELSIYDRWGQLVFYSTDPTLGWDGTFKGEKVQQDMCVVKLKYRDPKNEWKIVIDKVLIVR